MNNYKNLKPKEVFKWFNQISMIPRCSGNEKEISNFLVNFAKERNLKYYQDKEFNVIIRKDSSRDYENAPVITLQGHMDMVCDKIPDSNHDFSKDPILWNIEGDKLSAKGTSLGGDNGIGVSYALALLDDNNLVHPELEVLITTNEESGLIGASALEGELLKGDILLNLDAEEEGKFICSSSGGANSFVEFKKEFEKQDLKGMEIKVSGLLGGHSGLEIHTQRGNAIKILGRILNDINQNIDFRLVELKGGPRSNAIATSAYSLIGVESENVEVVLDKIAKFEKLLKKEFRVADPNLNIEVKEKENVKKSFTKKLTERLISFLVLVPYGVKSMSLEIKDLVESSSNVGLIVDTNDSLVFESVIRANVGSILQDQIRYINAISELLNANAWIEQEYPAWEFKDKSYIRDLCIEVYNEITSKEPIVTAFHAGLETGIINEKKPSLDLISFGPNLNNVHTFNESLSIASVERVWEFIKLLLSKID